MSRRKSLPGPHHSPLQALDKWNEGYLAPTRQPLIPRTLYLIAGPDVEFGNAEHEQA
jgi:hypothetical protein